MDDVGDSSIVDEFCNLGDMLSVDWDAAAAVDRIEHGYRSRLFGLIQRIDDDDILITLC